jgi:PleD family two-component response regulator
VKDAAPPLPPPPPSLHLPFIFWPHPRDRVDKLTGLELGVVDYISKPLDIKQHRRRVRNSLRRASQALLVNPVTNMPEGPLVDEKLNSLLGSETTWAVLLMTILGLDTFRELYGFVASDDVLRAVSLMMNNAVREVGGETDFIGHLGAHDFIIITDDGHLAALRERIEMRLKQSMEYFYPLKDREKAKQAMQENRLQLVIGQTLSTNGPFTDKDALKTAVLNSREVSAP